MGAAKIFDTLFTINYGEPRPLRAEYKYGKNDTILVKTCGDLWWVFELLGVYTDLRNKRITYHLGEFIDTKEE